MKNHTVWMSRPVFVTSTFRGMQAERDWLHAYVFPVLTERLRERYHHLEPIDLRWGVDLTEAGGQHAKELLAESKLPLVEVGFRSGFSHQSHFTRLFHRITGTTPQSYRLIFQP